jgi:TonB family protein
MIAALVTALALGQTQITGPQRQEEVDVVQTDGGTFVPSGAPEQKVIPPVLLTPSPAPYPESLKAAPISGTVDLELLIDDHGNVEEAKVSTPANPAFEEAALQAAKGLHFKPAQVGETPVAVRLHFAYVFEAPPPPPVLGKLTGEVRQKGTRKPLAGAALLGEDGKALGETGPDGKFEVELPPGTRSFTVQAPGHVALKTQETITANQGVAVVYRLEPLVVDPYETVVRGERERTELSRHTLQGQELREVPGTQGDPFRVVMLLPGVSSVASGISYPVVRGAQPAATGYYLDGVRVPALFHLVLGPAVVHPDFLERIDFYPGTPPPQYGRVLGGVVDARVARARDDRVHLSAYADLLNAGGFVEYPVAQTGTNLTVAGRYSYTPFLVARVASALSQPDFEGYRNRPIADFWDYQARVEQPMGPGRLRLLAFGSSDTVGTDSENPRGTDATITLRFHRADLRYRAPLPLGELEAGLTYGFETVRVEGFIGLSGDSGSYSLGTHSVSARAVWRYALNDQWTFISGLDMEQRRAASALSYTFNLVDPVTGEPAPITTSFEDPLTIGLFTGGYASAVWEPMKKLTITGGIRADSYHLVPGVQRVGVEPRITARYLLTDALALKAGGGIVHQAPTVLINVPLLDIAGLKWGLQEARQVDAGVEWTIFPGLELNADAYFTDIPSAIEFDLGALLRNQDLSELIAQSLIRRGRSYGLEVMVRHPLGNNWFGWISYSLQHSERLQRYVHFDEAFNPVEVRQGWLPFAFDQTHVLNAVVSYKFPGNITTGAVVHFNTGRPESGQVSSRTQKVWNNPATGLDSWRTVGRDEVARLPSFFRIDLRLAKQWTYDDYRVELYLDVLNASVSSETLAYEYGFGVTGEPEKRPIPLPVVVPMLGLKGVY